MADEANTAPDKIMYLIDTYKDPYAGTEKQLYHLVSGLDRQAFLPHLTLFRPSQYIQGSGFPCDVTLLPVGKLMSVCSILSVLKYGMRLRRAGYRLAHIFFVDASILVPVLFRLCGFKVIISRRDMGYWYTRLNTCILRFNSIFINAVIANCNAVKERTHAMEWVPMEKIHVIYNGHPYDKSVSFQPTNPSARDDRTDSGIIGIVANIRKVKRIDDLIRAFARLGAKHPYATLLIVGAGDSRELRILAEELGVLERITFAGKQEDAAAFIRTFAVAVSCSESEGLSNSIIEYMNNNVPVVGTRTGGNPELIVEGETGYLVDVGDIDKLTDRISRLLQDRGAARTMGHNAARHVRQLCDMRKMIRAHEELYAKLIRQSGG